MRQLNLWGGEMSYTHLFYQHIMFRHSCGVCYYTNLQRPSDITLADFWGWENTDSSLNVDDKGYSLVLCNTEKGRELFEAVKDRMNTLPVDMTKAMQPNLEHPSEIHPRRMEFEECFEKHGFERTMKRFGYLGWRNRINKYKILIKRIIKKVTK